MARNLPRCPLALTELAKSAALYEEDGGTRSGDELSFSPLKSHSYILFHRGGECCSRMTLPSRLAMHRNGEPRICTPSPAQPCQLLGDQDSPVQPLPSAPLPSTWLDSQIISFISLGKCIPTQPLASSLRSLVSKSDFSSFLTDICKRNRNASDEAATHV